MEDLRKYVAECIGTFTLVLIGCGTAMLTGCEHWGGYLTTAFAFGLVIVDMASGDVAYAISHTNDNEAESKCSGKISTPLVTACQHSCSTTNKNKSKCTDALGNILS